MSLTAPFIVETSAATAGNGQNSELTPAQVKTKFGAGNTKTASVNFSFPWQGSHINFRKGVPVVITDATLLAALAAAGAPVS